jgi:hypothetical protein
MFNLEALKKMTRETKVGLVVAGSFLLLVGVVVFCKLRDGGKAPAGPTATTDPVDVVVNDKKADAEPATSTPADAPTAPPSPPVNNNNEGTPLPQHGSPSEDKFLEPPPKLDPPPSNNLPLEITPAGGGANPGAAGAQASPLANVGGTIMNQTPAPPLREEPPPIEATQQQSNASQSAPPTELGSSENAGSQSQNGNLLRPPHPPVQPPALEGAGAGGANPDNRTSATPITGAATPPPLNPVNEGSPSPVDPVPSASDARPGSPPPAEGRSAPATILSPVPSDGRETPPGASLAASPIPPASSPGTSAAPVISDVSAQPSNTAADRGTPAEPLPVTSPGVVPATSPLPAGMPVGASVPPITIPASRGGIRPVAAAQVESFDEEEYRAKAGETFATISMQFYRTDKYAQALLLFNRNHPLAAIGVRQDPPVLQPGQPVFIPPTSILEKRYGSIIPELTPLAPARIAPAPTAERRSNAAPAPSALPQYRVQGEGEMMWEIASRVLKSGERWREIHQLNPALRPELRIAGGTVVTLPADAAVDPAHRP